VLVEAIANPAMAVPDFDALRRCCKSAGIPLIVDGTLVTPLLLDAEATGADVAVYSGSKFLAGAATTIGGLIVDTGRFPWGQGGNPGKQNRAGKQNQAGKENTVSRVHLGDFQRQGPRGYLDRIRHELMVGVGPSLSPQAAFLQIVGLETLALRLQRQESNTQRIAEWLGRHVAVSAVLYPGLTGHPDRERCRRAFRGHCGSVLSFTLANRAACFGFLNALHLVRRASNLGDTRSLALHPASTIYHGYWPAQRADLGVPDTLIRLSLGIEDPDDLIADLEQALAAAR
jgi:O-acetylhomoserine (thiol)-lyase